MNEGHGSNIVKLGASLILNGYAVDPRLNKTTLVTLNYLHI
jgi:hypothetical protein